MTRHPQTPPSSDAPEPETESLRMLVHGIFAITMTLMILDLRVQVPEHDGQLLHALRDQLPQVVAYVLGFAWLLVNWLGIRQFLAGYEDLDTVAVVLMLASVAVLSLTPVAVALLAESYGRDADFATAVRLAAVIALLAYGLNVWLVLRQRARVGRVMTRRDRVMSAVGVTGPVLVSLAISFVSAELAAALLVLDFAGPDLVPLVLNRARGRQQASTSK